MLSTVLSFRVIPKAEERYFTFSTGLQTQGAQKSSKLHCLRARLKLNIQITILRLKLAPYEYGSISLLRNSFHASSRIKYLNMTVKTTAKKKTAENVATVREQISKCKFILWRRFLS